MAPNSASPPIIAPTAMPAFVPLESLLPPEEDPEEGDCEAENPPVGVAVEDEAEEGVGESKSSLVTLKQGT